MNFWNFRFLTKNLNFQMFKTVLDIEVFVQSLKILKQLVLHLITIQNFKNVLEF